MRTASSQGTLRTLSSLDLDALLASAPPYPERIVCMTEETTETLYRIGEGHRVVGVSGFTVRPREARQKPKISTFLEAQFDEIVDLRPDLVLGFSDLQADLGRELAKRGVPVLVFNQRSVAEILQTIRVIGSLVGRSEAAEVLARELASNLRRHAEASGELPRCPAVFFEEWHDPLISGIRWVSELIQIAGGRDIFPECRESQGAQGRIVTAEETARRNPDLILASWCGRRPQGEKIRARPGFDRVRAVVEDQLYELDSAVILQPGPAALSDGIDQIAAIIQAWAAGKSLPRPNDRSLRRADAGSNAAPYTDDEENGSR